MNSPSDSHSGAPPWSLLVAVALLPSVIAVAQLGRIHPDEVYQALEPAYWRVHGYGVLAWEWRVGLRNWAVPLVLAGLLRLCGVLGIDHPVGYRAVLEVPQLLLNVWALAAAYRYAERRVGAPGGVVAVLLFGLYGAWLAFAGRTLSEAFSASFLVIAMEALDRPPSRRNGVLAGLALGLSVVVRYGSAVLVAAALVGLVARRQWRLLAFTCLAGMGVALALGALDWATWGKPFHSFLAYVNFNVFSGQAAQAFGASPASFYLPVLLRDVPVWAWVGLGWAVGKQRPRLPFGLWCAAAYVAVLCATPHKEPRFLYPALVLLVLCAAPGLVGALGALSREGVRRAVLGACLVAGAVPFLFQGSDGDVRGDEFRAIIRATRDPDARGLLIVGDGLWGVGGYFYVGKNIPWVTADVVEDANFQRAIRDARFNRAVVYEDHTVAELKQAGFQVVGRLGRETLLRRP